jgi:hypothetical protein
MWLRRKTRFLILLSRSLFDFLFHHFVGRMR